MEAGVWTVIRSSVHLNGPVQPLLESANTLVRAEVPDGSVRHSQVILRNS